MKNLPRAASLLSIASAVSAGLVAGPVAARETQLYWGDTHLHTSHSVDAYSTGNVNADPDTAYRFARGLPVLHPTAGTKIRIGRPLDFLVVADHAEMLELQKRLERDDAQMLATESGQRLSKLLKTNPAGIFGEVARINGHVNESALYRDLASAAVRRTSWTAHVDAAERHNQPGKFTALIGWEWTGAPDGQNLHRVVFTPSDGTTAKKFLPYTAYDSERPEDLWRFLEKTQSETGAEFVAIPHNANMSNGLMFDAVDSNGRPLSAEYARTRMRWEPVTEVTQVKGTSETHPALSPNDEFAGFEIRAKLLAGGPSATTEGSYVRSGLLRGLQVEQAIGVNPYKLGMVGSTDSHTGLSSTDEHDFQGKLGADMLPTQRAKPGGGAHFAAWEMSASGLAAAWATENTRRGIADAFRRKEVYATSGTRIALRVFGGFGFTADDARARDIGARGYAKGVPMGGDLAHAPTGKSPRLLIHAAKDPIGANLDRVQVVKGWVDKAGKPHEKVHDVAWSGSRQRDAQGKVPAVGNTVDVNTASYANRIGAVQLATVWTDPEFVATQRAFYYVRVIEIPTPRHQVYDAVALGIDPAKTGQALTLQERAWSSPIWYTP